MVLGVLRAGDAKRLVVFSVCSYIIKSNQNLILIFCQLDSKTENLIVARGRSVQSQAQRLQRHGRRACILIARCDRS